MSHYLDNIAHETGDIICFLRSGGGETQIVSLHDDLDPTELSDLLPSMVERKILATRLRLWLMEIEKIDAIPTKATPPIPQIAVETWPLCSPARTGVIGWQSLTSDLQSRWDKA